MSKLKLTAAQAIALISAAGADAELVDTADTAYSQDTALQAIDNGRLTVLKPRILTEMKDSVHGEQMAKLNKALRTKLHATTGIDMATLEAEKDTDKLLELSITHFGEGLKKDIGKDKQAWITERDTLMAAHAKNLADEKAEAAKVIAGLNESVSSQYIHSGLIKIHKEAKGLPVTANRETFAKDYHNYLKGVAVVKHNPTTNEIELYDPANPEARLYNATKTAFAKPEDFMEARYGKDGLGIWNTDTRSVNPADQMKGNNTVTQPASSAPGALEDSNKVWEEWSAPKTQAA